MTKAESDLITTLRARGASIPEIRMALTLSSMGIVDASTFVNHWLGADQMARMFGQEPAGPDGYTPPGRG